MMSVLAERLKENQAKGRKNLIVYITAGYPDMETTEAAVMAAEAAGAALVELGIPFSDPIADGPVIQKAAVVSLAAGTTTRNTIEMACKIRSQSCIPLAVMTYINIILHHGPEAFARDCREAGIDALIVPDLPPEEKELLQGSCDRYGLDLIQFIAPTSNRERVVLACQNATGFIYCVSNTGVTGVRAVDYSAVRPTVGLARSITGIPIAIGFGIGTPAAAKEAARYADGVIVGSAVVQLLETKDIAAVKNLVGSIRHELDREETGYEVDSK
jgi:tryptophan synthase alpha chain